MSIDEIKNRIDEEIKILYNDKISKKHPIITDISGEMEKKELVEAYYGPTIISKLKLKSDSFEYEYAWNYLKNELSKLFRVVFYGYTVEKGDYNAKDMPQDIKKIGIGLRPDAVNNFYDTNFIINDGDEKKYYNITFTFNDGAKIGITPKGLYFSADPLAYFKGPTDIQIEKALKYFKSGFDVQWVISKRGANRSWVDCVLTLPMPDEDKKEKTIVD